MAHFAQLDENNVVMQVIVVHNNELLIDGVESEEKGTAFCKSLFGENTKWKQTSYNRNFRKNYAGAGYIYREDMDAFIEPQPYPSWTLDTNYGRWVSPVPIPQDLSIEKRYKWDEATLSWVEVQNGN